MQIQPERVPKVSLAPLAESVSDKKNVIFYNVEIFVYWQVFMGPLLFFLQQPKRSGREQSTAMHSMVNKKEPILFHCLKPFPKGQDRSRQILSREQN